VSFYLVVELLFVVAASVVLANSFLAVVAWLMCGINGGRSGGYGQ